MITATITIQIQNQSIETKKHPNTGEATVTSTKEIDNNTTYNVIIPSENVKKLKKEIDTTIQKYREKK